MSPPVAFCDAGGWEAAQVQRGWSAASEPETMLFVDIDGVLNLGILDPEGAPLSFSEDNAERALARWGQRHRLPGSQRVAVERIIATCNRLAGPCEGAAYARLLSPAATELSDLLVWRLARLIEAAGPRCTVVLSSTWRLPKHTHRVTVVEASLSRHLGRSFAFDSRTAILEDRTPELRLQRIADFAAGYCKKAPLSFQQLRILVLDDFHTAPFGTWRCGWKKMGSAGAVEKYLLSRLPTRIDASVRLVHTYDEWTTDSGLFVQLGCGLTREHFNRALDFLEEGGGKGDACGRVCARRAQPQRESPGWVKTAQPRRESPGWVKMSVALAHSFLRAGAHWVG